MRGADTDICLSLESMRGRKYLVLRPAVDLPPDEVLEGEVTPGAEPGGAQVQMSIAPTSAVLISYFTDTLCRDAKLTPSGRTRKAIPLALGDDGGSSNLLIYAQASEISNGVARSLRLLVGRRKPPPSVQPTKIRPGEPLPRAPLFVASATSGKGPARDRALLQKSRSFQRAPSLQSMYAPPSKMPSAAEMTRTASRERSERGERGERTDRGERYGADKRGAPVGAYADRRLSMGVVKGSVGSSGSGRTPGRRGEKRKRDADKDEDRRRRAGKIVPMRAVRPSALAERESPSLAGNMDVDADADANADDVEGGKGYEVADALPFHDVSEADMEEEDIFGRRSASRHVSVGRAGAVVSSSGAGAGGVGSGGGAGTSEGDGPVPDGADNAGDVTSAVATASVRKRARIPQVVLDNKAVSLASFRGCV
jgi:hypothetical protein